MIMENIKILVPIDFSDLSLSALHSAQTLAKLFGGSITPFHSYLPMTELDTSYMMNMPSAQVEDYDQIEQTISQRLQEISDDEAFDKTLFDKPIVSIGNAAQSIVEESNDFDMIAMSTHGRTGFSRFFLGSVSEKVLRMANVPVLIVNRERQLTDINRILLTTDFSEHSKKAFPAAIEIAQKTGAQIDFVHVFSVDPHDEEQPKESVLNLRKQRLNILTKEELHTIDDQVHPHVIVSTDTPHEALINENLNNPYDLIVMSTVGRTGLDYLVMGSTTANIVRYVKSPVLSINPKEEHQSTEEE